MDHSQNIIMRILFQDICRVIRMRHYFSGVDQILGESYGTVYHLGSKNFKKAQISIKPGFSVRAKN